VPKEAPLHADVHNPAPESSPATNPAHDGQARPQDFKYRAFISYSHQDERWARWLQTALETYRVPSRLVGTRTAAGLIPRRLGTIFRDRSDLPSSADLSAQVSEALRNTANLIVICSANASGSRWVNEEIRLFQRLGRADRIFALIVGGEPNASALAGREAQECFPPALRAGADSREPIAADAREGKDGRSNARLKIIAGLLDLDLNALKQREQMRRLRRMTAVTALALLVTLTTSILAVDAFIARREAERRQKQAENLVDFMLGDLNDKLREVQRLDILATVHDHAMEYFRSLPVTDVTDQTLAQRVKALDEIGSVRADLGQLPAAVESYAAAAALAAELRRRRPDDVPRIAGYAQSLNWLGNAYWFQGDLQHALDNFRESSALLERASALRPQDTELAVQLVSARTNSGRVLEAEGDPAAAKLLYEKVLAASVTLAARDPGNARRQIELADAYDSLGKIALEQGQLEQAITAYRDVQRIKASVASADQRNRDAQENLLISDAILGRTLALCGAERAALHYVGEAVRLARALVAYDPAQAPWREDAADYGRVLAELKRRAGSLDEANQLAAEALRVLRQLSAADATNASLQRELAAAQVEMARVQLSRGDVAGDPLLEEASTTLARLRGAHPADRALRLLESHAWLARGDLEAARQQGDAARFAWEKARDAVAPAAAAGRDPNLLAAWAGSLLRLGQLPDAGPPLAALSSMGYQTRELTALVGAKGLPAAPAAPLAQCVDDAPSADPARKVQ